MAVYVSNRQRPKEAWGNVIASLGILVANPAEVRAYLQAHPELLPSLMTLCRDAAARLASQARLSLQLYQDPELDDQYLTLDVRLSQGQESLLAIIDQLNDEHEDQVADTAGWLIVAAEFAST